MNASLDEVARPQARVEGLDGLRAVAVLMVFVFHGAADLLPGGFIGVDIFFVLSGFVITGLLMREHGRAGRIRMGAFWKRRLLRLIPALVVTLLLVAAVTPLIGFGWSGFLADAVSALLYVFNFRALGQPPSVVGHLWSLSVEEQFYLAWPFALVACLKAARPTRAIALLAAASVLLCGVLQPILGGGALYFLLPGHLGELLIGSALGAAWTTDFPAWCRRLVAHPAVAVIGASVLALIALSAARVQAGWLYPGGLTAAAAASAAVIAHVVSRPETMISRLLSAPPLVWLGIRSYGFYLLHQPVLRVVEQGGASLKVRLLVAVIVTLVLCALSYRCVELPFLRRKQKYAVASLTQVQRTPRPQRLD